MKPDRAIFLSLATLALGCASSVVTETASAQTAAWRGRTMTRDGLFHVTRTRWGNGITPAGASVLIPLIETSPEILNAVLGRGDSTRGRSPAREPWAGWEVYAAEQKRATDLLERLSGLAGTASTPPPGATGNGRPVLSVDQVKERFGESVSPWESINNQ